MSDENIITGIQEEDSSDANDAVEMAQTIDDLVDVLLDEPHEEADVPAEAPSEGIDIDMGDNIGGTNGESPEEPDDFGSDEDGIPWSADEAGALDDVHGTPLVPPIGDLGLVGVGQDEDMLVSIPQDTTTIITHGTVAASSSEPSGDGLPARAGTNADRYKVSMGATFASLFIGLAVGVVATFIVMRSETASDDAPVSGKSVMLPGRVSKKQLSMGMVSYEYDGTTHMMSVEDVIEATGSLDSMQSEDGTYSVPSVEKAVEAARNAIVVAEAEKHGIVVSDGDVSDYVLEAYGVATADELAQQVGLAPEETERQLRERLVIKFLKKEVTGSQELVPLVEPMAPDDGDTGSMTERYGEYIRSLAGDEWNSTDNTWTDPDGVFAQAFAESMFDGHVASYDMARTAYDVVYHKNEAIQSNIDKAWSDYLNDLFRKVSITIVTLSR